MHNILRFSFSESPPSDSLCARHTAPHTPPFFYIRRSNQHQPSMHMAVVWPAAACLGLFLITGGCKLVHGSVDNGCSNTKLFDANGIVLTEAVQNAQCCHAEIETASLRNKDLMAMPPLSLDYPLVLQHASQTEKRRCNTGDTCAPALCHACSNGTTPTHGEGGFSDAHNYDPTEFLHEVSVTTPLDFFLTRSDFSARKH